MAKRKRRRQNITPYLGIIGGSTSDYSWEDAADAWPAEDREDGEVLARAAADGAAAVGSNNALARRVKPQTPGIAVETGASYDQIRMQLRLIIGVCKNWRFEKIRLVFRQLFFDAVDIGVRGGSALAPTKIRIILKTARVSEMQDSIAKQRRATAHRIRDKRVRVGENRTRFRVRGKQRHKNKRHVNPLLVVALADCLPILGLADEIN